MNYALDVSARAQAVLATFPFDLQERTYDELDALSAKPEILIPRGEDQLAVHDFTMHLDDVEPCVFLTIFRDDATRVLGVETVGLVVRGAQP